MFQLEESSNQLKHTASSNSLAYPRNDLFNKDLKLVALEKYTPGDESTEIESRVNELSLSSQSNESHGKINNYPSIFFLEFFIFLFINKLFNSKIRWPICLKTGCHSILNAKNLAFCQIFIRPV